MVASAPSPRRQESAKQINCSSRSASLCFPRFTCHPSPKSSDRLPWTVRDRSSRPRAHASGAESARVGAVPGSGCHRCAVRPVFSRQTTAAAQLWKLYTATSSRVLQRHLSDDGARADMEVASQGGPRRVQGRSMVACGGNHRNSGRRFRCFRRAASRRSPSRPSGGAFRRRPRKPLFSKKTRSSECAKVADQKKTHREIYRQQPSNFAHRGPTSITSPLPMARVRTKYVQAAHPQSTSSEDTRANIPRAPSARTGFRQGLHQIELLCRLSYAAGRQSSRNS